MLAILEEVTVRIDDPAVHTLMHSDDLDTFSIFSAITNFVYQEIKVFTETDSGFSQTDKIWQCLHDYQLCIAIYLQFSS